MAGIDFERIYWESNRFVVGVDEAGRGCLAGPVVAAAVVLAPFDLEIANSVQDSKKLRPERREELYYKIIERAVEWSVAVIDVPTIEQRNILQATLEAMKQAVEKLHSTIDCAFVDGSMAPRLSILVQTIVGGDALCASIAAASIVAKVVRDQLMCELARHYPHYGFERHKGYPTPQHFAALQQWGLTPQHRESFMRKWRIRQRQMSLS